MDKVSWGHLFRIWTELLCKNNSHDRPTVPGKYGLYSMLALNSNDTSVQPNSIVLNDAPKEFAIENFDNGRNNGLGLGFN